MGMIDPRIAALLEVEEIRQLRLRYSASLDSGDIDGLDQVFAPDATVTVTVGTMTGLPAIKAGATGYLLKDTPRDELFRAVRSAARGEAVLSPSVATRLVGQVRQPAAEPLSDREVEVLGLIARGSTNREAAAKLFISEATVKTYVSRLLARLGLRDRVQVAVWAYESGLVRVGDD